MPQKPETLSAYPFRAAALLAAFAGLATAGSVADTQQTDGAVQIIHAEDVDWGALNPARGDASPRAGTLWGDRTREDASGFLVRFDEGFASPPHIHNVAYRAVVISGAIHNDDPDAADMWLPKGSFWTQPAGESHVTAASGSTNIAYVEIDEGPYLVQPSEAAFDNGERPINVDAGNLVWLRADSLTWIPATGTGDSGAEIAFLWGEPTGIGDSGYMVRLKDGFAGTLSHQGENLRAIIIDGALALNGADGLLGAGGYFGIAGGESQPLTCSADETCLLYVRADQRFTLTAAPAQQ
ncbi:DUF4437 domain-containing protein [Henriciella sp.]|uniref:DUF4437 domain-containing protein n=1 Tax=Henriciella sp. TaxID=1968823 RepID=UPI002634B551|nr:DUF4437 domain-containing protein [Henriciella sp.]